MDNFSEPEETDVEPIQLEGIEVTAQREADMSVIKAATAIRMATSKLPIYRKRGQIAPTFPKTRSAATRSKDLESRKSPIPSSSTSTFPDPVAHSSMTTKPKKPIKSNTLRLGRDFYDQDCLELCKDLLGKVLCRRIQATGEVLRGTIVETEAYPGDDDQASQSYKGKQTPRNEAMFMQPGTAYVYFTYGMYYCFNISSRGAGAACLLRAVEPDQDYDTMHHLRNLPRKKTQEANNNNNMQISPKKKPLGIHELANGPSKLCMSFDIKRDSCDKIDMATSKELWLEQSLDLKYRNVDFEMATDKRIGIESTPTEARNKLWRFFVKDNFSESRAKVGQLKKKAKLEASAMDEN